MNAYMDEVFESEQVNNYTKYLRTILIAKYENSDLNKSMKNKFHHLTETQRTELLEVLQNVEELFGGTLITWKTYPVDFGIK